jgi:hypothetical protein
MHHSIMLMHLDVNASSTPLTGGIAEAGDGGHVASGVMTALPARQRRCPCRMAA